jgi:hypothetical protein
LIEKVLVKKPAVTIARMIKLKKNNSSAIVLPTDFIENLQPEDPEKRWAVIIFAPATKTIRTIPTKSPTVIKVSIEWSKTEPDTFQELGEIFMRHKIKTLYSTGICFYESPCPYGRTSLCPYVGFIDASDLHISEDQLRSEFLAMTNVTNVKLTKCSLESSCM